MLAALCGKTEIVKSLLEAGANPNAEDKDGDTALIEAAKKCKTEVVKLLLEAGADIEAKDKEGKTALMWAVFFDLIYNTEIITLLFRKISSYVNIC